MADVAPAAGPAVQKKKGGCAKYLAIGCVVVILLGAIGSIVAYKGMKVFVLKMAEQYTDSKPGELPKVDASSDEVDALLKRVQEFTGAIRDGQPASALELTSKDINLLIQNHPDWKEMAGKVYISMEGDKIKGQTSIPLDAISRMLKGRWLNASAVFRAEMTAGRLLVFIDSVSINGKTPPDEFMKSFRTVNFAENANKDPKAAAVLGKLESLSVQDGTLRIVPKQAQ
jgi:hypothetical protein